ncbi:MAG: hypothetical protein PHF37_06530 [Phycisphaerae bacterium]|nr:hypothetical protein [Phycisphaerae bacterium]
MKVEDFRDRIDQHFDFGNDQSQLFGIEYVGDEVSGIIDIAATGDITFKHGDLGSQAADTDLKLDADGLGIIDISEDVTDYHSLIAKINTSDNWRAWPVGCLPDANPHTTTVGHFTEVTGGNCSADGGYIVKTDDSDSLYIVAGMTLQGPQNKLHATDHQVIHVLQRVIAKSTYASGASSLTVYACDDRSGLSTAILTLTAGATTVEVAYPAETYPLSSDGLKVLKGHRLVVALINSVAMGTVRLAIEGYSLVAGPHVRPAKMYDHLNI